MKIFSDIPGRIRVRLRSEAVTDEAPECIGELESLPFVQSVNWNAVTGSLLVVYSDEEGARAQILERLEAVEPLNADVTPEASAKKTSEKAANRSRCCKCPSPLTFIRPGNWVGTTGIMATTLGASLLALTFSKKAHVWLGVVFLGTLVPHIIRIPRRRREEQSKAEV